jgi:nucleoside-diphosphate-sugar epimerase
MKKKNILITGFDGFIGKHLIESLDQTKYRIYGIGNTSKICNKFSFSSKKINLKNLLLFKKINIHSIIHCAGAPTVGLNYKNDFKKNALTTYEVLEFVRSLKKKPKIIIMSSMAVYGNKYAKKIKENFKLLPCSFYGLNKKISEDICNFYSEKFKINILILRISSVFGMSIKKQFIFDAINKLKNNIFDFNGTGNEKRDIINIVDLCNIIKVLLKKKYFGLKIINCGSGNVYKIKDIILKILLILKIDNSKLKFNGSGVSENPINLIPDTKLLKNFYKLGFNRNLDDDLKEFISKKNK